jgi:hypothetical protein
MHTYRHIHVSHCHRIDTGHRRFLDSAFLLSRKQDRIPRRQKVNKSISSPITISCLYRFYQFPGLRIHIAALTPIPTRSQKTHYPAAAIISLSLVSSRAHAHPFSSPESTVRKHTLPLGRGAQVSTSRHTRFPTQLNSTP